MADYIYAKSGGKPSTIEKLTTTFKQNGKIESAREIIKFLQGISDDEKLATTLDFILSRIPEAASPSNKMADQAYVNNKVATDSATFRGTYNLVSDLSLTTAATHEQIAAALATKMTSLSITPDNNDFCYVLIPEDDAVPSRIAQTDRYKYNGTAWAYEFTLGDADLAPYRKFKDTWTTDDTLLKFCQDVANDTTVIVGDLFLGSLTCSGLPTGMVNGEVSVQVLPGLNGKLLLLTITSTNLAPYHWEQSFYNGTLYGWKSFDENGAAATAVAAEALNQQNIAAILSLAPGTGTTTLTTNPEWKLALLDNEDKILLGKRQDDTWYTPVDLDDLLDFVIADYGVNV